MGTVIYSASPQQAFVGAAGTILLLLALGVAGLGYAIFQRKQSRATRIVIGGAGVLLLVAGGAFAAASLLSAGSPTQSVALNLDDKRVVEQSCGDNVEPCKHYVLESTTSTTAYEFDVPQSAYEAAQVDTCYRFTFYPNKGLFADSSAQFQQISNVARIETSDPSTCP